MFSCLLTLNKLGTQFVIASISSNFLRVSADNMSVESVEATLTYEINLTVRHGHCKCDVEVTFTASSAQSLMVCGGNLNKSKSSLSITHQRMH